MPYIILVLIYYLLYKLTNKFPLNWPIVILLTLLVGLLPTGFYAYYSVTGWPDTEYDTHTGPLYYNNWGDVVFFSALFLTAVMPAFTLFLYFRKNSKETLKNFLPYLAFIFFQAAWGVVNVFLSFSLAT